MSKIGQKTIEVPNGTTVEVKENTVTVNGMKGRLSYEVPSSLKVTVKDNSVSVERQNEQKKTKALHGLYRQLIANAVSGVNTPWEKRLEIVGTGFNLKMQGEDLVFKIGYSHPVVFKKVENIVFKVDGNTKLAVSGVDKQLVGQVAHKIKMLREPDVYKGKGIRYEGEQLKLKPGKKAKTAGA